MDDLISFPDKVVDQKLKRAQSLVGTSAGKPEHEWYPTPPYATQALLDREKFIGDVWEPATGCGMMSRVIEENGYNVMSTDLIDRGYGEAPHDFITSDRTCANIITNPPFTLAEQFIKLGLERTTGKVCMLTKLAFLEGAKRKIMFESTPFKACYIFSKRLSLTREGVKMKNSGMIAYCWLIFEKGYEGEPVIRWI